MDFRLRFWYFNLKIIYRISIIWLGMYLPSIQYSARRKEFVQTTGGSLRLIWLMSQSNKIPEKNSVFIKIWSIIVSSGFCSIFFACLKGQKNDGTKKCWNLILKYIEKRESGLIDPGWIVVGWMNLR